MPGLGRRPPTDQRHVERYSLAPVTQPITVERVLSLPAYRRQYDQGDRNACVGYASSWAMSICNRERYDPLWLWEHAKAIDEWPDTNPGDNEGTSVRAGMDVLRTLGHVRVLAGADQPIDINDGILRNEWATTVDQVRACIASGTPVVLGVDWFDAFFTPERIGRDWWIGRNMQAGRIAGGHAICCYGASDRRQAVKLCNSWGSTWPLVWLPYELLQKLLDGFEGPGEATVMTDRPER